MKVLYIHKKCVQLYILQEGRCFYCHTITPYQNLTRDHFNPRFKGGKNQYNVVLACGTCNSEKGHKTVYEFREFTCNLLAKYLRHYYKIGFVVSPNDKFNKVNRYSERIKRCTYLLNNPNEVTKIINNYYKINYRNALDELSKTNKLVPYLMTKTSNLFW